MNEKTTELLKIIKENPELPIKFMVDTEVVGDFDHSSWPGNLSHTRVGVFYGTEEETLTDEEDIKEAIGAKTWDEIENITEDECNALTDKKYNELMEEGKIFKAIIAYIDV